jgi:3-phosphoshikimate 1-carboxyvinyltransferase
VPGSKSLTNRALMVAALAQGPTTLTNVLDSDDSQRFMESLTRLGFKIEAGAASVVVHGLGGRIPAARAELYVGNAGTAARFLTAMLTLAESGDFVVDGDARMRQRPIGDLLDALRQLGAAVEPASVSAEPARPIGPGAVSQVCPPVRVRGTGLAGGQARVAGNVSSQFLSGLLMAAPYARSPVELVVAGQLNSRPYVDMTLAVMSDFGVSVERAGYERFWVAPQRYRARAEYRIECDASAASYFFAAPAICGGTVRVEAITRQSRQGDVAFLDILERMGCRASEGPNWIEVGSPPGGPQAAALRGVDVDLRDIPDTAQTLAAIAPFAATPTTIRGIASARLKETDRVAAVCAELARLGVDVTEHADGLTIQPCSQIRPAVIHTYDDHRMAMAFALIGLRVPGIEIANPACVAKTFPDYFAVLEGLRELAG